MPSKQKSKGSGFERDVAKDLSARYNDSFIRTPHSGAYIGGVNQQRRATLSENQTMSFKGDIVPPDTWAKLNIECKFYKDFPWHKFASETKIPLLELWLGQLLEVEDENDLSLLIMKFNRLGKYVAFNKKFMNMLDISRHVRYNSNEFGNWLITEYTSFWDRNQNTVKKYCTSLDRVKNLNSE